MSSTATRTSPEKASLILLIAAFAAVYVIWGSTYLAIKYAIETIPSFLMAAARFLMAGAILYGIGRLSPGYERPKLVHWKTALIVGTLLLAMGNGGVVIAEHYIPSSLAALLVATVPFWIVLLGWMFMGKGRPNLKVTAGLALGFLGVWLLISGQTASAAAAAASGSDQLFGAILIIGASLAWAAGSLYGTRAPSTKSAILGSGMQMLAGGAVLLIIGTVTGEWSTLDVAKVSSVSWIALAYLVVFGAIVAYTAYSWLLKNASPTSVTTYAYVNPAVAVVLGWAIAGESMTAQMLVGAAIIVGSVALITLQKKAVKEPDAAEIHDSIGLAAVRENYST
jgi:drug/metabolite transporter (DMT)-like permease